MIQESHSSDLDQSASSNYQIAYTYDGLMRLTRSERRDIRGDLIETFGYEYDAASNITKEVKTTYQ